jgi:hypothetical protein
MRDDTPNYLKLAYEEWFDNHPESLAEMQTTTVRLQKRSGASITYVKNTAGGDIEISKEEFDARYWARERGARHGK